MSSLAYVYAYIRIIRWLNVIGLSREQIELCVDILERLLVALSPVSLAQDFREALQGGLTHHAEGVKILALTQVLST